MRRPIEWALRALLFIALGLALWQSIHERSSRTTQLHTSSRTMDRDIARVLANPIVSSLDVNVDGAIAPTQRGALVALRRAGVSVHWHGKPPSLAIEASRERKPDARARIAVVSADDATISLADSAGVIDTLRAPRGSTLTIGTLVGAARATHGAFSARAAAPFEGPRRAVMVLSRAGWEARFVMSALSEAGWIVRARLPTAPNVDVHDDAMFPLDTARYDVVIALDSSAADLAPAIARFVTQGGGLIAVGGAMTLDALRGIVPAQPGQRLAGRILLADDTITPPDLPLRPLGALRRDALTLQKEAAGASLVARRAGMGRVVSVGYDESWRWRMLGGTSGEAAHREWWSRATGSVSPEHGGQGPFENDDAAPRAALMDALGPASASAITAEHTPSAMLPLFLLVIIMLVLLTEVASRRFRGVH